MSLLSQITLPQYTIYGASLGGLYTSLYIPQLDVLLDVGFAMRRAASVQRLFLSHTHLDHVGALPSLLGMRGMSGRRDQALEIYLPNGLADDLQQSIMHFSHIHDWPLAITCHTMLADQEIHLKANLWVRALQTFHPVPSLGYLFFERVKKLKKEYKSLPGKQIKQMKEAGEPLFVEEERLRVAYITDTLIDTLKHNPHIMHADVLIIECTFLDQKKPISVARAGCHIHLDELIEYAPHITSQHIVLMHFSQIYKPSEVYAYCQEALGPLWGERLHLCLPPSFSETNQWWM